MAISNEFIVAVEEDNKLRVRIMLKDMMVIDKSMKKFDEMLSYAQSRISDLYDIHDCEKFEEKNSWTTTYMNAQLVKLLSNFSKERIEILKKIISHLYSRETSGYSSKENIKDDINIKYSKRRRYSDVQKVGGAVTLVGAGAVACGLAFSSTIVTAIGGVVAISGIGMIALNNGRD